MVLFFKTCTALVAACIGLACGAGSARGAGRPEPAMAAVTGIHHMPRGYRIGNFYLKGESFENVGEEGGGGGIVCCILVPKKWRRGLSVDVRWSVEDWRSADLAAIRKGKWDSVQLEGIYQAQVPLEEYTGEPGRLYVHFFAGGKVRIVTDTAVHPVVERPGVKEDPPTRKWATQGKLRKEYFSKAEVRAAEEQFQRDRKKYGDWR